MNELREGEGYEFIIVGDTDKFEGCLVYTCGKKLARAEQVLAEVQQQEREGKLPRDIGNHRNFRIKRVVSRDMWWNDPSLAN